MNDNNYTKDELDEMYLLGKLLERDLEGAVYNEKTQKLSVPYTTLEQVIKNPKNK